MDIRAEVANALHWDLAIPRHRVTAEMNGGLVTLHGVVDRACQKSCAEAIAGRAPGVIGKLDLRQRVQWTGEQFCTIFLNRNRDADAMVVTLVRIWRCRPTT